MASSGNSNTNPSEIRDQASMQSAQDTSKAPNETDDREESPEPEWKSKYERGTKKQPKHMYGIGATVYVLSGIRGSKGPFTVSAHNPDGTYNLNNGPDGDRTRNNIAEKNLD